MAWSTDPESVNNDTTAPAAANNNTAAPGDTQQQQPAQNSSTPAQLLVCHNAKCTCDQAVDASPKPLKVLSHNKYFINDNGESKLIATTKENALPNLNFGKCKVPNPNNPSPCTAKLKWKDYYDHVELPGGAYVLTDKSTAVCTSKGGNIKIVQHGQQANITTEEVEKANAGGWAVNGPLVTEELIYTEEQYNNTDADGVNVKSIEPVQYGSSQPVNTPVEFKANFNGNPTDAQKQGVNWIIYDTNGQPMQLRTDVGERLKVTFNKPGTYLIEAYGKTAGDKKVTTAYTVKGNELGEVKAANNATKVRVQEPVQFTISSLFDNLPLPGNTSNITWTVTKNGGPGTPDLLNSTGPATQVVCDDETTYVVTANLNGVVKQSKVIEALKNGITSVNASKSSGRVNDTISFTVKDQFKISPAREPEKAAVKWQCIDAQGKQVAEFSSKVGETVDYKFDKPGEYTIQPYMVKPSSKVSVKITIAQPALLKAQWEYPEGGRKNKTGWNEPNHPLLVFQSAEGLMIDLEFGFINKDGKAMPISTLKGIKIPDNQTPDLKGHDFIPDRNKLKNAVKEGDLFYFKVIPQNKEYEIDNANIPQPQEKLKLVTAEQIISIEFLKDGKPVINAQYGDQMQCRIRTRNLSAEKLNVQIYRQEARMGADALRADTLVLNGSYPIGRGGLVVFDFTLNKAWEKTYSEKLHHFYAKISESEFFGTSTTLVAFKNDVPANGGSKVMAGVEQVGQDKNTPCFCKEHKLIWGDKISCSERKKVYAVAEKLWGAKDRDEKANQLMAIMHIESAGTFSPSIDNGVGYCGLIQFSDGAAKSVGTTRAQLVKMSFIEQMDYVEKYFEKKKDLLNTLTDLYLLVLKPNAVGKGNQPDYAIFDESVAVPNVPFDKNNISKEPWVTKYGYSSNPAYMTEEGEKTKRKKWVYSKQAYAMRPGFDGGKTYVKEVASVITDQHYIPGKAQIYTGACIDAPKKALIVDNQRTPWMKIAIEEAANYGGKNEKLIDTRIREYHTNGGSAKGSGSKTPWCSSFACWCIQQTNFGNPRSAGSQSFLDSKKVEKCEAFYGAVAVFTDCDSKGNINSSSGHVSFVFGKVEGNTYILLGGNQNDMIKASKYDCSGNAFYSYSDDDGNKIYKKFRGFYKPKDYTIKDIDKLKDTDVYKSADEANLKLNITTKSSKNGEKTK